MGMKIWCLRKVSLKAGKIARRKGIVEVGKKASKGSAGHTRDDILQKDVIPLLTL